MKPDKISPGGTFRLGSQQVARIGYGAMQLRNCAADPAKGIAILQRAIALGVDHIDTAQFYGNGFVNELIRKAITPAQGVVVSSKVGADPDPEARVPIRLAQRPEQLRASVEANLVALGLEQIPLMNLRRADGAHGMTVPPDQLVDIDDQLAAMISLRTEGKIGAIGLSAVTTSELKRALPAGIACVQNAYSLVERKFEDMLALCLANDIAWVPFFPLGGATPGLPKVTEQPAVLSVAKRLRATPSQVGLAWLLQRAPNCLLIPGTANLAHLEQNLAVASVALDPAAMTELDTVNVKAAAH